MPNASSARLGPGARPRRLLAISATVVLAFAGPAAPRNVAGPDGIQGTGHVSAAADLDGIQGSG